ncbi:hypothetical protein WG66_007973 [Moniliophthora roreri]|nr:hypothetical protein WG66_007973 [Moniliophthora roreri]
MGRRLHPNSHAYHNARLVQDKTSFFFGAQGRTAPSKRWLNSSTAFATWNCSIAFPATFYTPYIRRPHATLEHSRYATEQQRSKDPLEIVARLGRLYATESSSKRKKTIELAGNMIGEVIKANLRHTMVAERHRNFYNIVEEILKVLENPHHGRFQHLTTFAQDRTITRKLRKAYASLQLPECRSSKIRVAFTIVDHTATALAIIGEAIPVMAPGKAAAVALAKIAELAKTAQGNKDEALSLSKHAEDARKRLLKRLDDAKNLPPEAFAEIGEDIQLLQSAREPLGQPPAVKVAHGPRSTALLLESSATCPSLPLSYLNLRRHYVPPERTETVMQSNNPLQLPHQAAKSSEKKLVELVTSWVDKLISDNPAHTIDSVLYRPFYEALEKFLKDMENPSSSRSLIGAFARLTSANASKRSGAQGRICVGTAFFGDVQQLNSFGTLRALPTTFYTLYLRSPHVTSNYSRHASEHCARLDKVYAAENSKKRKKFIELAGNMISKLIDAHPGHVMDEQPYRIFYGAVEEAMKIIENPYHG